MLLRVVAEVAPARLIWLRTPLPLAFVSPIGGVVASLLLPRADRHKVVWPLFLGVTYLAWPGVMPAWGGALLLAGVAGVVWLSRPAWVTRLWPWWGDAAAFIGSLLLYLFTLAPSVLPGDSGELQLAAATLGITHPTGYPLYVLLGRFFALVPVRSVAYRLNLFSAVTAAGAVWAVYRVGRVLGLRPPAALIGASLLAVSETLWSQAVIAEKYALNAFFVALTIWLGLRWRAAVGEGTGASRHLHFWAATYGLSLTHHRTMLLLLPAWLLLILLTDRQALRRAGWRPAASLCAPLSLYLLLPLFSALNPPYAYARVDSVRSFLDLVLAREYRGALFGGGWGVIPGRLVEMGRLALRQFSPWGMCLVVGGWAFLYRRERVAALTLLAGAVGELLFALNYNVPNNFVYYLPAYVIMATCAGAAVEGILSLLVGHRSLALFILLSVAALPVYLGGVRWAGMDQRRAYANLPFNYDYARMGMRALAPGALVVGDWMPSTVLRYVQVIDGLSPTAQIEVVDPLEWGWERVVDGALSAGRPVYLARPVAAAGERRPLSAAGPLVRVLAAPERRLPATAHPPASVVAPGIRLLGYRLEVTAPGAEGVLYEVSGGATGSDGATCPAGSKLHLTLYWQADNPPVGDYAVALRLTDGDGMTWLERQSRHPVGGSYPTWHWQRGEVVADYYALPLPPLLSSGIYTLQVAMTSTQADVEWVQVADIRVRKPLRSATLLPGVVVRRPFGPRWVLMGYDAPREVVPGERVSITLFWLLRAAGDSQPPSLRLSVPGGEQIVAPFPLPADDLQPGSLLAARYDLTVPADLERVKVRTECPPTWGRAQYTLPTRLASTPPLANFGDLVLLRSYTYRTHSLRPGETAHITLEWEAIKKIDERYKVFVHVLGHNGLPIAQQDNEPVEGTYPFTRWSVGERVTDRYAITLPRDLAPGEYQVEVGLYRITDLGRLPVLGANREAVDDKVFLDPLRVR